MTSLREIKNQWKLKDWECDCASYYRYKEQAERLEASEFESIRGRASWWRERMSEIASRYPNVKW